MIDWNSSERLKCTYSEKKECLETFKIIIALSIKSRTQGLVAIQNEKDGTEDFFLSKGIELITDGTEPCIIKDIFKGYLLSGDYTGKEFLKRVLIAEGILAIQKGENPMTIRERLASFFGESFYNEIEKAYSDAENIQKFIGRYYFLVKDKLPLSPETSLLENPIKKMDNRSIQRVMLEIDSVYIASALKGASGRVQISIMQNLSNNVIAMIKDELESTINNNVKIVNAQQKIIEVIQSLKKSGIIIFNDE